MQIKAKFPSMC